MKTTNLFCIILIALFFTVLYPAISAETAPKVIYNEPAAAKVEKAQPAKSSLGLSVETFGAIRYVDIKGPPVYGAGVDVGYAFNRFVIGHVRALAYETDDWGGSVVDEGSLLVEAIMLKSANGGASLSAIGGADRDFVADDWGFGVGLRGKAKIYGPLSAFADARVRAWIKQEKDALVSAGLQLSF